MRAHRRTSHVLLWTFVFLAGGPAALLGAAPGPAAERPLAKLQGHGGRGVAFNGAGTRVVTWDDRSAQVWDVATARPLAAPVSPGDGLICASLDADGDKLLTARAGGADVWDVATGKRLQRFWHQAEIRSAAFDAAGGRVLTAGGGHVRVWDAKTGERTWMSQHANRLYGAEFAAGDTRILGFTYRSVADLEQLHPGSKKRFSASAGHVLVWDATDGRLLSDETIFSPAKEFSADAVLRPAALSPDGHTEALSGMFSIRTANPSTGAVIKDRHTNCNEPWLHKYPLVGGGSTWFAFHPAGHEFVAVGEWADVVVWDVGLEKPRLLDQLRGEDWQRAEFVDGGARLMVAGRGAGAAVLDARSGAVVFRSPKPTRADVGLRAAISADGRHVAMADGAAGETVLWRLPRAEDRQPAIDRGRP